MATVKNCTDLVQSKKLAEFLPIESADMFYTLIDQGLYLEVKQGIEPSKDDIPCWSLAALLELIPAGNILLRDALSKNYKCINTVDSDLYDNPIDAAFEMLCLLKENGKL